MLERPAGADGPGLHAVGDLHRLRARSDSTANSSGARPIALIAASTPRRSRSAASSRAGRPQPAPAEPGVERPHRAAVIDVSGELWMLGGQRSQSPRREHVGPAEALDREPRARVRSAPRPTAANPDASRRRGPCRRRRPARSFPRRTPPPRAPRAPPSAASSPGLAGELCQGAQGDHRHCLGVGVGERRQRRLAARPAGCRHRGRPDRPDRPCRATPAVRGRPAPGADRGGRSRRHARAPRRATHRRPASAASSSVSSSGSASEASTTRNQEVESAEP